MAKKSIYLFSVALLGVSMIPNVVWGEEVTESEAANITTELVERANNVSESPAEEVAASPIGEQEIAAEQAEPTAVSTDSIESENSAVQIEEVTDSEVTETSSVSPESTETTAIIEPDKTTEAPPTVQEKQPEPAATGESSETRASAPALKEENDGKIVDHQKTITDENTQLPNDYAFMPNFANVQGIVIGGTNNYVNDGYTFTFDLDTEKPNTITVTYKNVGSYQGKVIDMRITVKGWTALAGKQILQINKDNGITMSGIRDVLLNYSFLDNLTANPVKLSGFFNFTDIGLEQSIDLFDANNIQNFYVTKSNQLYYKKHDGYIKIGEINNNKINNLNMHYWLTYIYKNVSGFDVRYNQEYETNAVFNYSFKLPVTIGEIPPGIVDPTIPIDVEVPEESVVNERSQDQSANPTAKTGSWVATVLAKTEVNQLSEKATQSVGSTKSTAVPQIAQAELPKTNEQSSSYLAILGGACISLFTAIFLNKKKG